MSRKPNALIVVRLSTDTDVTTSPERQLNECVAYCERRGWHVVGTAEDFESATRSTPWQRPQLSSWLNDRAPEFDVIVAWRLDRLVRKVGDLHDLIDWARDHGSKAITSVTEPFDLTDPSGAAMASMIASFAQMESLAASERVTSMRQHLLPTSRWGGGSPPYGYRTFKKESGRYLEVNPATAPVVQEAARRVVSGESINAICRDLENRGVPSPADSYARRKVDRDYIWHPVTLKKILASPALRGLKTRNEPVPGRKYHRKVLVRDELGQVVRMAEPILTEAEWNDLQSALASTSTPGAKPASPRTPFLGVIKCGGCGKNLQLHITKKKRRDGSERVTSKIRCLSRAGSPACKGYVFEPDEQIIGPVTRMILSTIGGEPVTRRIYVKGEGSVERLAEIEASINYHVAQLLPGGIYSSDALQTKGEQALAGLRHEFEHLHRLGAGGLDRWEYTELGMTFADRWRNKDRASIANDLLNAGITVECHPQNAGGHVLRLPDDLRQRFATAVGRVQPKADAAPPPRPC
ncbi:recombinase family protein [Streptomyces poriferorum]|uniref:Recombinase family protein n=1 Tax=Streptomyces poriferorum TaxID=2798799 RepID=A0ABY9IVE5_9ACTN|nr:MULTISPECIES: recombinase family protein [unclassified Streptomyces]MDP5311564.1 recombinase family protein [Streptomyces sp. Alt4]WLQ59346.1 recombinase family protein [Streptomyces sp. Alt2]